MNSYRDLSETQLITIRDLLRFSLTLKSQAPPQRKSATAATVSSSSSKSLKRTALQNKPIVKERPVKYKRFATVAANFDSRWSVIRLEYAAKANVIVNALKKKERKKFSHSGMTRQEARDAARLHIGDTCLLDYVLKSMNNVIVGAYIVRRAVNPGLRILNQGAWEWCEG